MLTDTKIRNAKPASKPYKLADGGGLYLEVRQTGARLWRYRYRIAGKENVFALGEYPAMSLADARSCLARVRDLVKQGIHPAHERNAARAQQIAENANTFKAVALEWVEENRKRWSASRLEQVQRYLPKDVFPFIGNLPIGNVTSAQVLAVVRRVEQRGSKSVAFVVRQLCGAVFRYAVATMRADSDPTGALRGAIVRPKTKHCVALSREQVGELVRALGGVGGHPATRLALRLMLLTFVRTSELLGARWEEFDLDAALWRIPAGRMKMGEEHVVPLSRQALAVLRELEDYTWGGDWLFPNVRTPGECMGRTTLNRALERMGFGKKAQNGKVGIGFSGHGFRATAATILYEAGFHADVIERQLAHAQRNQVRAAYDRSLFLNERAQMMQQWADMVDSFAAGASVVPLRRRKSAA